MSDHPLVWSSTEIAIAAAIALIIGWVLGYESGHANAKKKYSRHYWD